jgi:alpha-galactosidase
MAGPNITIIGGGSYTWSPLFIRDIAITPELHGSHIRLHDIDPEPLNLVHRLGQAINDAAGGPLTLTATTNLVDALQGADFVILTITTGGLGAMRWDLEIPEKHGIYQTVGDTVGPGGLARGLRNIPVIVEIAHHMARCCPDAWLLNYTNPMSTLCRAVARETPIRVVGLCHEYFGVRQHLAHFFQVEPAEIACQLAGINHLTWITRMEIGGADRFSELLPLAEQILDGSIQVDAEDSSSMADRFKVKARLLQIYGALPAAGDRHIAEFFPFFLGEAAGYGQAYGLKRTSVAERAAWQQEARSFVEALLAGQAPLEPHLAQPSGEAANRIIAALRGGKPYTGPLNLPNRGQISNLPRDAIVETLGTVSRDEITPLHFGKLPEAAAAVTTRHIANQEGIVQAALTGDHHLALQMLANDPLVHDLAGCEAMLDEMLAANRTYLPEFFPSPTEYEQP